MILRELLTVFGFAVDDKGAKEAERQYSSLKGAALGVATAAAAAAAGLILLVKEAAATGDRAAKTGKTLGITAQEVQELEFAARRSGATFEQFRTGILKVQQKADEARRGNKEYAKTFARLGISVNDSSGKLKGAIPLLSDVARQISKLPTAGEQAAAAMKLFEEGGAFLIPFLQQGDKGLAQLISRAQQLGFVMDNETAAKAEELTDGLLDLDLATKGVRLRFSKGLIPTALRFVQVMTDLLIVNRELIDRGLRRLSSMVSRVATGLGRLVFWVVRNRRFFAILGSVLGVFFAVRVIKAARAIGLLRLSLIKTLLTAAAPIAFFVLLAALMEDIAEGAKGLREIRDFLNMKAQDPNAHPVVKVLARIATLSVKAIDGLNGLTKEFFDDSLRVGGVWNKIKKDIKESGRLLREFFTRPEVQNLPKRESFQDLLLKEVQSRARRNLGVPAAGGGGTTITIPEVRIELSVTGTTAGTADIKQAASEGVEQGMGAALRNAKRELEDPVVR